MLLMKRPPHPITVSPLPSVTIFIPAKDEGERIRGCIQSALDQDYPRMGVVAIDDRSTDKTGAVMDEMAAANPRLEVLHITQPPAPGWTGKNNALYTAARDATRRLAAVCRFGRGTASPMRVERRDVGRTAEEFRPALAAAAAGESHALGKPARAAGGQRGVVAVSDRPDQQRPTTTATLSPTGSFCSSTATATTRSAGTRPFAIATAKTLRSPSWSRTPASRRACRGGLILLRCACTAPSPTSFVAGAEFSIPPVWGAPARPLSEWHFCFAAALPRTPPWRGGCMDCCVHRRFTRISPWRG